MAEVSLARRNTIPYITKTLNEQFARGSSLMFDGNNRSLALANLATELGQADNLSGAIEVVFKPNRLPGAGNMSLFNIGSTAGANDIRIGYNDAGRLKAYCRQVGIGGTAWELTASEKTLTLGDIYHLILTHNGIRPYIYLNGELVICADTVAANLTFWLNVLAANTGRIGDFWNGGAGAEQEHFDGEIYRVRTFNRHLTLDDAWKLMLGPVDNEESNAMTNNHLQPANPGLWAAGGANIVVGAGEANMLTYVWGANNPGTLTQLFANLTRTIQDKKRYRFRYTVAITVAPNGTLTGVLTGIGADAIVPLDLTVGVHEVDFETTFGLGAANFVITLTPAGANIGSLTIGNMRLIQIGCVAAYEPEMISGGKWCDSMHSTIEALVANVKEFGAQQGAVEINPIAKVPSNHKCKLVFKWMTADITYRNAIPAGYRVVGIEVINRTANAWVIDVVFAAVVIVNAQAIGANGRVACVLTVYDSTWAEGAVDITIRDSGAGWNASANDVVIWLERMI